jgi:SAM-dependent methyltransferase
LTPAPGLSAALPHAAGPKGWSVPATSRSVLELLEDLDWPCARVADVGAGRGAFSHLLATELRERHSLDPRQHVLPCDAQPASFAASGLECRALDGGRLPFPDGHVDAAVAIEVVEHVEDPFAFLRELARITRPGGRVIVTTPNVLSANSRVRSLCTGFAELFDPLPLAAADARLMSGHIHPISPYYLALAALRASLVRPRLSSDRTKRSAALYAVALWPLFFAGALWLDARLARKHPDVLRENRELLASLRSWRLLTGRTAILCAEKPA